MLQSLVTYKVHKNVTWGLIQSLMKCWIHLSKELQYQYISYLFTWEQVFWLSFEDRKPCLIFTGDNVDMQMLSKYLEFWAGVQKGRPL